MNLIQQAFEELFPEKGLEFTLVLKYSRAFKGYNATIRIRANQLIVRMAYNWKEISPEIQVGLIQTLLVKLFAKRDKCRVIRTNSMDMYNSFIRNLSKFAEVTKIDRVLQESFHRVNEQYFNGFMDMPNLVWGQNSLGKLGSYDYAANTITISKVLEENQELLDYVVYHEMLHKKLKFFTRGSRSYHHTRQFRILERQFQLPDAEKKLRAFLRKKKLRRLLKLW